MQAGCEPKLPPLFVDIETFSSVDITSTGAFRYMEAPDFDILLVAYAFGDDPVQVLDLTKEDAKRELVTAYDLILLSLTDPSVTKVAHNAAFERAAFHRYFGEYMPPEQWEDTMVLAAYNGLPQSLDAAGAALGLKDQKIKEGTSLISYFCKPCKPTVANSGRTRNLPLHAPEKWARFIEYCKRDVEVSQQIYFKLRPLYREPDWEKKLRCLDARINEFGVLVDTDLAQAAVDVDTQEREANLREMKMLTGLDNPNSPTQLKDWMLSRGLYTPQLDKKAIEELLKTDLNPVVYRVLQLRKLLGKTSCKKYDAMLAAASPADNRLRGMMQYYGAGRTGRWAGRIVQPQNLPQNHLDHIGDVREMVKDKDIEFLHLLYDSVPDVLSQLIRTALVAKPGHTFLVADYSAIEARVIAYLAGEQWRMDVFKNGGDIYCSSASQMFKVPVEKHGQNAHLRQKGKIAELACGYGGGVSALRAFGADKMGLSEQEMKSIVDQWRIASPTIPRFWREAEKAAVAALENPGKRYRIRCGVTYWRDANALRCCLPSGRTLAYWSAYLDDNGSICFMAQNQTTRKWEKSETWGGKLVENIVQAYARDCLAVAMLRLAEQDYHICFSVHDELIAEEPKDGRTWRDMADVMGQPIDWAPGLLLRAEGYQTDFYMKD